MGYGSGTLFQRGKKGTWYYQAWVDGRQVGPLSSKSTDRKDALRELDKLLGKRGRGEITAQTVKSGAATLGELLDTYLEHADANLGEYTAYIYRQTVENHLRKPFGAMKIGKLTTQVLDRYRKQRRAAGDSDVTVNRELSYLRAAMRLARKRGASITLPYFPMVNEGGNARQGFREEPEFVKFLEALEPDELKPFACCAYYGGLRRGELIKLKIGDIHMGQRILTVAFGKNGETRNVPIFAGPMLRWFQWLWKHRRAGQTQAFVYADGRPVTLRNFYKAWHAACAKSGIGYFIPHDSRRSLNRRLNREGVPQSLRMKTMGWRSPNMDRRYGVVDTADAEVVRRVMEKTTAPKSPRSLKLRRK